MKNADNRRSLRLWAGTAGVVLAAAAAVMALFTVEVTVSPPPDTRIILEHTHRTYISPPCFEQAETTNHLEETTLEDALSTGYLPESDCTQASLAPVSRTLASALAEQWGLAEGPWDW